MSTSSKTFDAFLALVRLGVGYTEAIDSSVISVLDGVEWKQLKYLADAHGLSAVVLDGIEKCPTNAIEKMPQRVRLEWIGEVVREENVYTNQQATATDMANAFHNNGIRTYVLKGMVIAECYPNPRHRLSVDMDCYLSAEKDNSEVWALGNNLIKSKGFRVATDFYKNSTFYLPNLVVENHHFLTPFRGNRRLAELERTLQSMIRQDSVMERFKETWLYKPPVMVSALFLIEHAYSHFLHEGLTWRMVLDWMLFSNKHREETDRVKFCTYIDEFGFRKFYDSFLRLGYYLLGEISHDRLTKQDQIMLSDVWSDLDVHETARGIKGKLALAGNTWRARWKYKYFSEISMFYALWIQVRGFLFEKDPKLY